MNQNFSAAFPNTKWVGHFTYIDTTEGWLYLAVVLDLFSRKVVGWAMAEQTDTALVENSCTWLCMLANLMHLYCAIWIKGVNTPVLPTKTN